MDHLAEMRATEMKALAQELPPAVAEHPGLERALDLTLQLMIGAAMSSVLHGDTSGLDVLIDDWKALFPRVLEHGAAATAPGKKLKGRR